MSIEKEVAFDPYHKWLGIPKAQRPPTHYQLLGLAQGETDAEVIEEAAIRQTTHLRAYQVGPHADDCTRLLNEISAARQVLVNPQKRQDYDQKLAQLAAKRAALVEGNAKPVEVESAFADLGNGDATPAAKPRREPAKPAKPGKRPAKNEPKAISQTVILGAAAGGGVLIVGLVALIAYLMSPPPQPAIVANGQPKPPPQVNPKPVDPIPPPVDPNPVDPIKVPNPPIGGAVPPLRSLGAFGLRSAPKQLLALADGRVFFGTTAINQYDPSHRQNLQPSEVTGAGEKGLRYAVTPNGRDVYIGIPDANQLVGFEVGGRQIANLRGAGPVSAMAISRDGQTLVTGTYLGDVATWSLNTHERIKIFNKHPRPIREVVFSRDGWLVASLCDESIQVWSVQENRPTVFMPNTVKATSIELTPDGRSLLAVTPTGLQSCPTDRISWTPLKTEKDTAIRAAFANDRTLAVLSPDGPALYDWPTMRLFRQVRAPSAYDTMALTPDGRVLFVGLANPSMMAFGVDDDAVLKPYVSSGEKPVTPVTPVSPPNGVFAGNWHFQTKPTGTTKIDLTVRNVGGVHSAQFEIKKTTSTGRGHVTTLLNENGKLRGNVIVDAASAVPYDLLTEILISPPVGDTMRVEFRGARVVAHIFNRSDGVEMPPPPKIPPKIPMPPVTPKVVPVAVRVDVPSEEKIKDVAATVRDNFKAEYAKKSAADKAALAEKLLQLANDTTDDPTARYVLFCEARDLAAAAGKWSIVADAFEQLDLGFKVDLLPQREAALQILVKAGLNKESAIEATEAALQGVGEAVAGDKLPLANSFLALASTASAKSLSVPHIGLVKRADAEMKLINLESDAVKKARESLKTTPDDAAANLAVGRFDALRRGEWETAIAILAKGGDGELPALARKEMASPKDGAGQQKIADEWWALAEKEKDSAWMRAALQNRAAHWYRLAATQVSGLTLALVHERLKTIDEAPSPFRLGSSGGGAELKAFTGHKGAVTSLHLMSDGKRLISGSLDATVRSWDLKTGKGATNQMAQPIHSLTYSPNEQYLAVGFKDTMKVIDANNPNSTLRLATGPAWPGTYFADEKMVISFSATSISTSNINGGGSSGPNPARGNAILWSPTYFKVLVLGEETWVFGSSEPPAGFPRSPFPSLRNKTSLTDSTCASFSPTQPVAAVATADKKIHLLHLITRNVSTTFDASAVTRCLAYAPGGDRLLSASEDGIIRIWDVATGKEVRRFSSGSKGVSSLIVTPDGKQIITGGSDGVIRVWAMPREKAVKTAAEAPPLGKGTELTRLPPNLLHFVSTPAGSLLLTSGTDGLKPQSLMTLPGSAANLRWSADGKWIAFDSNRDGTRQISLADFDGKNLRQLTTDKSPSLRPSWSPNGKKIVIQRNVLEGPTIFVVDVDGAAETRLGLGYDPALSPDGTTIVFAEWDSSKGYCLSVMDVTGSNRSRLTTKFNTKGYVYPAWSPDGKRIAWTDQASGQCHIFVADSNGQNARQLTSEGNCNTCASWSPDGRQIAFIRSDDFQSGFHHVMNVDGTNQRLFLPTQVLVSSGPIGWRPLSTKS